ncbi:MAG: KEOPS complex subunit Cgi121 [Nitrososphaeria archaeon]
MIESIEDDIVLFCSGFRVKEEYNAAYIQKILEGFGDIVVQVLDKRFIADAEHARLTLLQAFEAFKRGLYVAKKARVDILLKFLCTKKIESALRDAFPADNVKEFALAGFGSREKVIEMVKQLESFGVFDEKILEPSNEKLEFLIRYHNLSEDEVKNYGVGKILCDRSAAVFSKYYKLKSSALTQ